MSRYKEYIKSLLNTLQTEIVEVLNYSGVICKVNNDDYNKLQKWLELDNCNKIWRLEYVKRNNYFYIENCDLQDLQDLEGINNNKINQYFLDEYEGYIICDIVFYEKGFILKPIKEVTK